MNKRETLRRALRAIIDAHGSLENVAHQCHVASLSIVRAGVADRVARGWCRGVTGQHSWAVVGEDCYAPDAYVIDATLWSYRPDVRGVWIGKLSEGLHHPHGEGSIWGYGKPRAGDGEPLTLRTHKTLPRDARAFLDLCGPLDQDGWMSLLSRCPVGGWPSDKIIHAAYMDDRLRALIPVDRVGMLTNVNPGGMYQR